MIVSDNFLNEDVDGVGDLFAGVDSFPIARRRPKGVLVSLIYANVWVSFSAQLWTKLRLLNVQCTMFVQRANVLSISRLRG